jgi:CheY-like chemotaxis protein
MCTSIGRRLADVESVDWTAFLTKPVKASQMFDALADLFVDESEVESKRRETPFNIDEEMAKHLPLRILLAEDNAVNQKVALRLLAQMGYRADVAGNGLEALQSIERQRYDVVLMDVQMPEMDGLEASRRICQTWPRGERPRIVAMTANAMHGDREMCLEAGMDDYLSKPVRPGELAAALSRCRSLDLEPTSQSSQVEDTTFVDESARAVLDTATLASFRQAMGEDFLPELIEMFGQDSQTLVDTMRQATTESYADALRRAAHTLKSNSASFGALTLSALCRELEEIGLDPTPEEAAERVERIAIERNKVQNALEAL